MGYDIVATDTSLEFNQVTPDYKKSFPLDYRPIYNHGQIRIHAKDSQQLVLKIVDIAEVDSITDNRTGGAGVIAVPVSVTLLYDIIKPFFFLDLVVAAGDQPFILEDGSINPAAFGGTGETRAVVGFPNSIGFNSITPDQDDTTLAEELRFNTPNATPIITAKSSNFEIYNPSADVFYLVNEPGFLKAFLYGDGSITQVGHDGSGVSGTGSSSVYDLISYNTIVDDEVVIMIASVALNTGNTDKPTGAYHARDADINGHLYVNSLFAGGTGGTIDKSEYLFAENFEVQGGIAVCTVQPELLAGWTDLSYTTRGYVDSKEFVHTNQAVNYTAADRDFVRMTTGATDKTVTLPVVAGNSGVRVIAKKVDAGAGNLIIDGNAAETIDGELTQTITNQYTSLTFYCNGTTWDLI